MVSFSLPRTVLLSQIDRQSAPVLTRTNSHPLIRPPPLSQACQNHKQTSQTRSISQSSLAPSLESQPFPLASTLSEAHRGRPRPVFPPQRSISLSKELRKRRAARGQPLFLHTRSSSTLHAVRQLQKSHVTLRALYHQWDTHDDIPQPHNHVFLPSDPPPQPCSTCATCRTLSRQHGTP